MGPVGSVPAPQRGRRIVGPHDAARIDAKGGANGRIGCGVGPRRTPGDEPERSGQPHHHHGETKPRNPPTQAVGHSPAPRDPAIHRTKADAMGNAARWQG